MNYLNLPKYTWIDLNLPEFTWIYRFYHNLPEFTWIYMNWFKFTCIYLNLPGSTWIYLNLPEFTWIYQNGFFWVHLGSLGFIWVHMVWSMLILVDLESYWRLWICVYLLDQNNTIKYYNRINIQWMNPLNIFFLSSSCFLSIESEIFLFHFMNHSINCSYQISIHIHKYIHTPGHFSYI